MESDSRRVGSFWSRLFQMFKSVRESEARPHPAGGHQESERSCPRGRCSCWLWLMPAPAPSRPGRRQCPWAVGPQGPNGCQSPLKYSAWSEICEDGGEPQTPSLTCTSKLWFVTNRWWFTYVSKTSLTIILTTILYSVFHLTNSI